VAELQASFRMIPGSDNVYCHWLDRARSVGDIRLSVRPVKALDVNISAEYRADRKIYMFSQSEDISASVSMRDAFSLNLGARYKFSDRWTAFAELTNITANRYYENFLVGTQCFGGHIGAVYRF
ncbi:MAG: hypothetical protein K2O12_01290, partial [Muribaculaceae bacterium]|nr:hypothetical protein [Muribaculaceae bacterium]